MFVRWLVAACVVAAACTSFEPARPTPNVPPAPDAEAAREPEAGPNVRRACPPAAAPGEACTTGPLGCKRDVIFQAKVRSHPHGLSIGAGRVFWLAQPLTLEGYNGGGPAALWRVDRAGSPTADLIARDLPRARTLVVHVGFVYWAETATSGRALVRRLPVDAPPCETACAEPELVAENLDPPSKLGAFTDSALVALGGGGGVDIIELSSALPTLPRPVALLSAFPALAVDDGQAFASAAFQKPVLRILPTGADGGIVGFIDAPDGSDPGVGVLATNCQHVYGVDKARNVFRQPASATGGPFAAYATLPSALAIFSSAADARFVYFGGANGGGLYRIDTQSPRTEALANTISVWGMDVDDDGIVYGEHGGGPNDPNSELGSIFVFRKR
jgi:hypothetical protein